MNHTNQPMSPLAIGHAYPSLLGAQLSDLSTQSQVAVPGASFRVERIDNGFLVHLSRHTYVTTERHYAENERAVGELVTATLIRWMIEGK